MLLAGSAMPGALPSPLPSIPGALPAQPLTQRHSAAGMDKKEIRIALVGCGGRGTALAIQALDASHGPVKLVAVADVFEDKIQQSIRALRSSPNRDRVCIDSHQRFVGLDAFRKVMDSDVDVVLLATPPGFRPLHFAEAIAAGKQVLLRNQSLSMSPVCNIS